MSCGTVIAHARDSDQNLNVKSSTECELVVNEYCPYNICQMISMEKKGYPLHQNVLVQDNQSTMKIKHSGKYSCMTNSQYMDIRKEE